MGAEPREVDDREPLVAQTEITFFKSGGPGGQHRNKTETGVRLRHRPTGLTVSVTEERSQHRNRIIAFERLREKLRFLRHRRRRRIPTRLPRTAREARLADKRLQSVKKSRRGRVDET